MILGLIRSSLYFRGSDANASLASCVIRLNQLMLISCLFIMVSVWAPFDTDRHKSSRLYKCYHLCGSLNVARSQLQLYLKITHIVYDIVNNYNTLQTKAIHKCHSPNYKNSLLHWCTTTETCRSTYGALSVISPIMAFVVTRTWLSIWPGVSFAPINSGTC